MALSVDDKKSIKEYVNICIKEYIDLLRSENDISINKTYDVKYYLDILPMPKGRGFLDTNDTCLLK
jgi:hypothetical protein